MKRLPLGIQTFRDVIEDNHVYVDKTMYIHQLISNARSYFLSRPRRFGKSLLLDTIAEVFKGSKELFKGLWIYDSGYDFKSHPVVKLDMSSLSTETTDAFRKSLLEELRYFLQLEEINSESDMPSGLLKDLVRGLHSKYNKKVVVLIDEYDCPILDHITKVETAEANRTILRDFFKILKPLDPYIRFIFITGVTKFTKTSVFSALNSLSDITMLKNYVNICGVPVDELELYFGSHMKSLANHRRFKDRYCLRELILAWYDGYSWDGETKLLNPFGLLSLFHAGQVKSFWYVSGSPKFLIDLIKNDPESVLKLQNPTICEREMDAIDIHNLDIKSLLFQTGYLTVAETVYPDVLPEYLLEIPNLEVREAFFMSITAGLTENKYENTSEAFRQINKALKTGDLQIILDMLRSLFRSIPHQLHINKEAYYHSIFFSVMKVLGFKIDAEVSVSKGRIDAVLELGDKIYVFEFKYKHCPPDTEEDKKREIADKALELGMKQINDRGYADRYTGSGKTIYKAAFVFLGRDNVEMFATSVTI